MIADDKDDDSLASSLTVDYVNFPAAILSGVATDISCQVRDLYDRPVKGATVSWTIDEKSAPDPSPVLTDDDGVARTSIEPSERASLRLWVKATHGEETSARTARSLLVIDVDDIAFASHDPKDVEVIVEAGSPAVNRTFRISVEPKVPNARINWQVPGSGKGGSVMTTPDGVSAWTTTFEVGDSDRIYDIVAQLDKGDVPSLRAEFKLRLTVYPEIYFSAHEPSDEVVWVKRPGEAPNDCTFTAVVEPARGGIEVHWMRDGDVVETSKTDANGKAYWTGTFAVTDDNPTYLISARCGGSAKGVVHYVLKVLSNFTFSDHSPKERFWEIGVNPGDPPQEQTFSVTVDPRAPGVDVHWAVDGSEVTTIPTSKDGVSSLAYAFDVLGDDRAYEVLAVCGQSQAARIAYGLTLTHLTFAVAEPLPGVIEIPALIEWERVAQRFTAVVKPRLTGLPVEWTVDGSRQESMRTEDAGAISWETSFDVSATNRRYDVVVTCGASPGAKLAYSVNVLTELHFSEHYPEDLNIRIEKLPGERASQSFSVTIWPLIEGAPIEWWLDGAKMDVVKTDANGLSVWKHDFDILPSDRACKVVARHEKTSIEFIVNFVNQTRIIRASQSAYQIEGTPEAEKVEVSFIVYVNDSIAGVPIRWFFDGVLIGTEETDASGMGRLVRHVQIPRNASDFIIEAKCGELKDASHTFSLWALPRYTLVSAVPKPGGRHFVEIDPVKNTGTVDFTIKIDPPLDKVVLKLLHHSDASEYTRGYTGENGIGTFSFDVPGSGSDETFSTVLAIEDNVAAVFTFYLFYKV